MKSIPVELLEPSLDRDFPIRVLPEKPADDAQPDRLVRTWRVWQNRRRVFRSENFASERPIQGLKLSIVTALIREIKRLVGADRLRENSGCADAFCIYGQPGQPARICVAPLRDVRCVFVKCQKLSHTQSELSFQKIRLERKRPGEMRPCFRNPCFTAERYATVVMSHERVRLDPERRLVLCDRIVAAAQGPQNIAEIVARAGAVRTQRDRTLRMGERFRQPIRILKQGGKMDVSIDKVRVQRDGTPVMLLGARILTGQFEHRGQIKMRNRRIWRSLQDQFKLFHRFIEAPERPESPSEIIESLVIPGVKRHCLFKQDNASANNPPAARITPLSLCASAK